jgi:hypothetical protein
VELEEVEVEHGDEGGWRREFGWELMKSLWCWLIADTYLENLIYRWVGGFEGTASNLQ